MKPFSAGSFSHNWAAKSPARVAIYPTISACMVAFYTLRTRAKPGSSTAGYRKITPSREESFSQLTPNLKSSSLRGPSLKTEYSRSLSTWGISLASRMCNRLKRFLKHRGSASLSFKPCMKTSSISANSSATALPITLPQTISSRWSNPPSTSEGGLLSLIRYPYYLRSQHQSWRWTR